MNAIKEFLTPDGMNELIDFMAKDKDFGFYLALWMRNTDPASTEFLTGYIHKKSREYAHEIGRDVDG